MASYSFKASNKKCIMGIPVSLEQPPQDSHSHDPHGLLGGPGILGTLPLTKTSVPALPARLVVLAHTRPENASFLTS